MLAARYGHQKSSSPSDGNQPQRQSIPIDAATRPGPDYVRHLQVSSLKPSPENEQLYQERTYEDTDYARLVDSIRRRGVEAPLLVSLDNYIISGHQRQKAAIESGQPTVPVLRLNVRRSDYSSDAWLALLREHNCGREKTFDELVRERLVDIDPNEAIAHIVDDQIERTRSRVPTIVIGSKEMKRYRISEEKQGMVDAILEVLRDLKEYLPVSLRAIHYRLLVKSFFRNQFSHTPYLNDKASYKDLSQLTTRLRVKGGVIPMESLCDETRPVITWSCWRSGADFIAEKCDRFLRGYARDLLQSQPQHFEIVAEKLTVQNFIEPVAGRYCMPVVILRGNSGIDARYQLVERFRASGKKRLFLFCLGDCDPDGDSIVDSTLRSLRDDFELSTVSGMRVAMTHTQADALHLPKMLDAKEKRSSNLGSFMRRHGRTDCYELEAVAPDILQEWLDNDIRSVIDVEAYNHEVEQQKQEATAIMARRQAILKMMQS
jgi:hypothetical protein